MTIRQAEIEALIEDLIENTLFDIFQAELSNKKEARAAFEILKQKLEETDLSILDELFD